MSRLIASVLLAFAAAPALAAEDKADATIRTALTSLVPNAKIESIAESQLPGFYEVVSGGHILYVSADGKYLVEGSLWDIQQKRDLTDVRRAELRKTLLKSIGPDKRIVFKAEKPKHTVTVFTDIDCGYCRRLHQQIADYNKAGITVEYLFFPRAGEPSESFTKAVNVWCAADRNAAMTAAKAGETLENKQCDHSISEQYALGQKVGITGTPAVMTEDGTQIGGYLTPDQMIARIEAAKVEPAAKN